MSANNNNPNELEQFLMDCLRGGVRAAIKEIMQFFKTYK